jgi:hypothetical protein
MRHEFRPLRVMLDFGFNCVFRHACFASIMRVLASFNLAPSLHLVRQA